MEEVHNSHYKYRRWPLFLPVFTVFTLIYYFFLSDGNLADSLVWSIFLLSYPLITFFHLKIIKTREYRPLGLDLLYAWMIGAVLMYLLMLSYIEGEKWFGALFMLFLYLVYQLVMQIVSFVLFKINTSRFIKDHGIRG